MNWLVSIVAVGAVGYALLLLFARVWADRLIFPAPPPSYQDNGGLLKLLARDGTALSAVHLPAAAPALTVLYLHGNGEDLGHLRPRLEAMQKRGYAVFAFDYRGYGTTPGRPSEAAVYADSMDVLRYLTETMHVPSGRILVYGRSLGGGPAVELARRERLAGLVLEGAFTSAFRVVTQRRLLPRDRFDNLARIAQVKCPVLVVHGRRDRTVPWRHGSALFAAAPEPKRSLWVEQAGHNDLVEVAGESYWRALQDLADRAGT